MIESCHHNSESVDPAVAPLRTLLVHYRRVIGLTQEDLAAKSGVSVRAIGDIERGRTLRPQQHSVEALASALGLTGPDRERFVAATRGERRRSRQESWASRPVEALCVLPQPLDDQAAQQAELDRLRVLAKTAAAGSSPGMQIVAISGPAGAGKTSSAVEAAHQLAALFPNSQLFWLEVG